MGNMVYNAVIVCGCEGLRTSTVNALKAFAQVGGKIIIIGDEPQYIDAHKCAMPQALLKMCEHIAYERGEILNSLQEIVDVEITLSDGSTTEKYMHALNAETDDDSSNKRLFICHSEKTTESDDITVTVDGEFNVVRYDAETGGICDIGYEICGGKTIIRYRMHPYDSLLVYLSKEGAKNCNTNQTKVANDSDDNEKIKLYGSGVSYRMEEPNLLLLDTAQYSFDDMPFKEEEEILKIDGILRQRIGLEKRTNNDIQPWARKKEKPKHTVTLKFAFESEIETDAVFALENGCNSEIVFNGIRAENVDMGYYVDVAIRKTAVCAIKRGRNEILVKVPFGKDDYIENMYLLGSFGVMLESNTNNGGERPILKKLVWLPDHIEYKDVTCLGLPFYGGNIVYSNTVYMERSGSLEIIIPDYRGACVRIYVDGNDIGLVYKPPYNIWTNILTKGEHTVEIKLYGNRYNTFAALHNTGKGSCLALPEAWQSQGDQFTYSYNTKSYGLLSEPSFYADYL